MHLERLRTWAAPWCFICADVGASVGASHSGGSLPVKSESVLRIHQFVTPLTPTTSLSVLDARASLAHCVALVTNHFDQDWCSGSNGCRRQAQVHVLIPTIDPQWLLLIFTSLFSSVFGFC